MRPTGLLMLLLGIFLAARLVTKDSKGETLAGRLIGGQPSSSSTSSQLSPYAPAAGSRASRTYTTGAGTVLRSQATGIAARTHSPAFARDVLRSLGDPLTRANVSSLTAWIDREGNLPGVDRFNPLDTSQPEPGSYPTNPAKVQSFKSWASGVTATAQTIVNGFYPAIASALKSGQGLSPATNTEQSRELETWSGSGYGTF